MLLWDEILDIPTCVRCTYENILGIVVRIQWFIPFPLYCFSHITSDVQGSPACGRRSYHIDILLAVRSDGSRGIYNGTQHHKRGVFLLAKWQKMDTFKSRIRNKNYPAKAEFGRKGRNRIPWNIPFPLIESKSKGKAKWLYELSFSFHLKMIPPPQLVLFFDIIHCRLCTRYTRSCTSFYKHVLRPLCLNFGLAGSFEETA